MTASEDIARAWGKIREARDILDDLATGSEIRHIDPELLTAHELQSIMRCMDRSKEDLREIVRRLTEDEDETQVSLRD